MEYLDIFDEDNHHYIGINNRNEVHIKGLWHREVVAILFNENNELLLQKRSADKLQQPNLWAFTAGHVAHAEDPKESMQRELLEELGVPVGLDDFILLDVKKLSEKYGKRTNNQFRYIYFVKKKITKNEIVIQEEEISDIKFIKINELKEIVNNQDSNYTFSSRSYMDDEIQNLEKIMEEY